MFTQLHAALIAVVPCLKEQKGLIPKDRQGHGRLLLPRLIAFEQFIKRVTVLT